MPRKLEADYQNFISDEFLSVGGSVVVYRVFVQPTYSALSLIVAKKAGIFEETVDKNAIVSSIGRRSLFASP